MAPAEENADSPDPVWTCQGNSLFDNAIGAMHNDGRYSLGLSRDEKAYLVGGTGLGVRGTANSLGRHVACW
jgi:hypothetical protein